MIDIHLISRTSKAKSRKTVSAWRGSEVLWFQSTVPRFPVKTGAHSPHGENSQEMNCREEIREHLIAEKMKFWLMIARTPVIKPNIPTWRARRNFWYLCRKYPDLSRRIGCDETSVFRR